MKSMSSGTDRAWGLGLTAAVDAQDRGGLLVNRRLPSPLPLILDLVHALTLTAVIALSRRLGNESEELP